MVGAVSSAITHFIIVFSLGVVQVDSLDLNP